MCPCNKPVALLEFDHYKQKVSDSQIPHAYTDLIAEYRFL